MQNNQLEVTAKKELDDVLARAEKKAKQVTKAVTIAAN